MTQANPEKFEQLDLRKISDDPTGATWPSAADEIFIRELNAMAADRWRDVSSLEPWRVDLDA